MINNIKGTKKDIKKFAITIGPALLFIGGFLFWKSNPFYIIFIFIALSLIGLGLFFTSVLKPVYFLWMWLANIMGRFMSKVILTVLFFLVLTPIGLLCRLFGRHFLDLKWDKTKNTYWNYRSAQSSSEKYKKQF